MPQSQPLSDRTFTYRWDLRERCHKDHSGGRGIRTHEDGVGPALELFKSSPFGLSGSPPGRQSPMLGEGFTAQRFGGTIKARKCPCRSRRWSMVSHSVPEPVDLARTRRAELLAAITALESALAAPR